MSGRGSLPPAPIRACGWLESCGSCYLQDRQTGPRQRHDLHQLPEPAWRRNPAPGLDNAVAWRRFPTWSSNNADESRPCRGPADHQGHHRDDRAEYAQSFPHGALLAGHSRDGPCGSPTPCRVTCRHPNRVKRRAGSHILLAYSPSGVGPNLLHDEEPQSLAIAARDSSRSSDELYGNSWHRRASRMDPSRGPLIPLDGSL